MAKRPPTWDASPGYGDEPPEVIGVICGGCVSLREETIEEFALMRERIRRLEKSILLLHEEMTGGGRPTDGEGA